MKTILIEGDTIPEVYEKALLETWEKGERFPTEYDREGDPLSRDCVAVLHINHPLQEPRIHRAIPNGIDFLEEYRLELVNGIHDYYMNDLDNPNRWKYTYSGRMFQYDVPCDECASTPGDIMCPKCGSTGSIKINQIEKCIEMLKKTGHSRRALASTWKCWTDLGLDDPPCLQILQFRIEQTTCDKCNGDGVEHFENDDYATCKDCIGTGVIPKLNVCGVIRSNDAYKGSFDNLFGVSELQKYVADRIGVGVGSLVWVALSYHIYGSYFKEFEGFLNTVKNRTFEERTYTSDFARPFWIESCDKVLAETGLPTNKRLIVEDRKKYLESLL